MSCWFGGVQGLAELCVSELQAVSCGGRVTVRPSKILAVTPSPI